MSRHSEPETPAQEGASRHAAPEGAGVHPLIDLARDPNPGVPDHAKADEDEQGDS
ncbi:MAG TPA: hypothetical protein VG756_13855 [Pseudonocardiaceae bacterium]|jgi:hypothetical protein|nr:hypothetical protein [Pseudonocardiaceae bacterium]